MGSGHILVYMFDVLMQIYEAYGYRSRDAVQSIVQNNLYGLDIDDRAAQLAYFSVMMKARQYDSRFFTRGVKPNVYAICESNSVGSDIVDYFTNGDAKLKESMDTILTEMRDAKEYGSILNITPVDFEALYVRFDEVFDEISMFKTAVLDELLPVVRVAEVLVQKYDTVCTNPPYMGSSGMSWKLGEYVKKCYPDSKSDLFAVFIERCGAMAKKSGYQAMITQHAWMFLSSFEKLRAKLLQMDTVNMAHLGARAFDEIGGEVVQTASFVLRKSHVKGYKGVYCRLIEPTTQNGKEEMFLAGENRYEAAQDNFSKIPGAPIAYWLGSRAIKVFESASPLGELEEVRGGLTTGDNNRFLRYWFEVTLNSISFCTCSIEETETNGFRWFPIAKGGEYRKWYGNNVYVVNWKNNGQEIKYWVTHNPKDPNTTHWSRRLFNIEHYFKAVITWSGISGGNLSMRMSYNSIFGSGAKAIAPRDHTEFYIAFLNSIVSTNYLHVLSPTLNYEAGHIASLPIIKDSTDRITPIVDGCISLSRTDWDSFETSWGFKRHPLIAFNGNYEEAVPTLYKDDLQNGVVPVECEKGLAPLAQAYDAWERFADYQFQKLKANEEELNRIFIDIYGLRDELTPEVEDKDVTVRLADKKRDIRSLISYAVGCMFGRYSLDEPGLILAGYDRVEHTTKTYDGDDPELEKFAKINADDSKSYGSNYHWVNQERFKSFPIDVDNIIPICDDEYFDDDITGRFVKFIETVYGKETLDENLRFIADALGGSGQPKEVIRNYFLNDFYADHLKIYQKRPIYWLFDSGKKNGFKALIYMHRYAPDTLARMRTDYVHEQQALYRTAIADLGHRIENASTAERVKLNKQLVKLQGQADELRGYEEKIHHLADQMIRIDLDDGVKHNYEIFGDVLAKIK